MHKTRGSGAIRLSLRSYVPDGTIVEEDVTSFSLAKKSKTVASGISGRIISQKGGALVGATTTNYVSWHEMSYGTAMFGKFRLFRAGSDGASSSAQFTRATLARVGGFTGSLTMTAPGSWQRDRGDRITAQGSYGDSWTATSDYWFDGNIVVTFTYTLFAGGGQAVMPDPLQAVFGNSMANQVTVP